MIEKEKLNKSNGLKIVIDARFLGTVTGIGRYVEQLVLNLEKVDSKNEYLVLINKENKGKYQPARSNFKKIVIDIPWYGIREQLLMPRILKELKPDLVHFPHFNVPFFYNKPFVVSIHDLILTKYPSVKASTLTPWKYWLKDLLYRIIIKHAVQKARTIITMADFTANEIVKKFQVSNLKVKKIHEGVTKLELGDNGSDDQRVLNKYNINSKFILYVGNAYPHKNLEFLIKAWQIFLEKDKKYKLVLIGKEDYFYTRLRVFVQNLELEENVLMTGFVPDKELRIFYQQAKAYVFPSLCEGFGLPPIEAMQCQLPVLSSNYSCLPEILKNAVIYFDPQDKNDLVNKLEQILYDQNLRKNLNIKAQELLKKYSWKKMAAKVLSVYNEVLDKKLGE